MAMPSSGLSECLIPSLLVDAAMGRDERQFVFLYGDAPILLVQIPAGDDELQQGLSELDAGGGALPFRTEFQSIPNRGAAAPRAHGPGDGADLAKRMRGHQHFAFAVRKRVRSDTPSEDRISVGRARNRDLVLRHSSVSKFHAWFEASADGALCLYDAESTNHTHLNSKVLEPRLKTPIGPGDSVRFGAIECLLCAASTLWACLHRATPRTRAEAAVGSAGASIRPLRATSRPPGASPRPPSRNG
jgi:FHA domain